MIQRPDWTEPENQKVIDLSSNVCWDTILHAQIRHLLHDSLNLIDYPDPYPVYRAICDYYDLPMKQVALGLGSAEVIDRILKALKPKKVYIVSPTWGMIDPLCQINDIPYSLVDLQKAYSQTQRDAVLYIANPSGFTGEAHHVSLFDRYQYVILDEAYADWAPKFSRLYTRPKNCVITKSLSKSMMIAGARVGFAWGELDLIDRMQQIRPMIVTTKQAEIIVPNLIKYTNSHIARMKESKRKLESRFECGESWANFVRFKSPNKLTDHFGTKFMADHYKLALADWTTLSNVLD
jgi:histidinol-phosphate/aromatic aminotransferase/cobyric acid decarboxylase-like protein